jgi:hypothetical protein
MKHHLTPKGTEPSSLEGQQHLLAIQNKGLMDYVFLP